MDIGTWLTICLRGRLIGSDVLGNRYYLEKSQRRGSLRASRWVVYAGERGQCPPSGTVGYIAPSTRHCAGP